MSTEAVGAGANYLRQQCYDSEARISLLAGARRPLRQPGKAIADGFLWLATKSPFIQATLKSLDDWTAKQEQQADGG